MRAGLSSDIEHHAALDKRMEKAVRGIRLLQSVSWPQTVQRDFLADWRSGKKRLPSVQYQIEQHQVERLFEHELKRLAAVVSLLDVVEAKVIQRPD